MLAITPVSLLAQVKPSQHVLITKGKTHIEYCDSDGLAIATIHTEIAFANRGKSTIILSRSLGSLEHLSLSDASGKVVYSPHPSQYGTRMPDLGDVPDGKLFETASPGTIVHRDFVITIPISKGPASLIRGTLLPGKYVISAARSTWPFYAHEDQVPLIREKWARYGNLLIDTVRVSGVEVRLFPPDDTRSCSREP